jgi:hypothetical protein
MDETSMDELNRMRNYPSSLTWRRTITRKGLLYLIVLFIIVAALSLILASPLLLRQLAGIRGVDWAGLSDVGQTYGAASAILSAVALIGIALSLLVQARQARTERIRITREHHMELLRVILDAPDVYGPVIGLQARSAIGNQRFLFCTMWMNYAKTGYQMGIITEHDLRGDILASAFESGPLRDWYIVARRNWSGEEGPAERRFLRIVDEEYRKALKAGPAKLSRIGDALPRARTTVTPKNRNVIAKTMLGVAIGILLGSRLRPNGR